MASRGRVLVRCPCCGHTVVLSRIERVDVPKLSVRLHTVSSGGRAKIINELRDVRPENGAEDELCVAGVVCALQRRIDLSRKMVEKHVQKTEKRKVKA